MAVNTYSTTANASDSSTVTLVSSKYTKVHVHCCTNRLRICAASHHTRTSLSDESPSAGLRPNFSVLWGCRSRLDSYGELKALAELSQTLRRVDVKIRLSPHLATLRLAA